MKRLAVVYNLLSCLSWNYAQKVSYEGYQLWKVKLNNTDLKYFEDLERNHSLQLLGGDSTTVDLLVKPTNLETLTNQFKSLELEVRVAVEDVETIIDPEPLELDDRKGHRLTWRAYHPLVDIYNYLYYIANTYPKLVSLITIGNSVEDRSIKILRISNGNPNNSAIWIDGGIHAREWISPSTATYIIDQIVNNYDYEPESIRKIDWYIVPVLNPDGYEFSYKYDRFWRKNRRKFAECVGVDLNRNFGYQWDGYGASLDPCTNRFRGLSPFSEPETASIARFFSNNKNRIKWKGFVSLHSYGQQILYPWGSATTYGLKDDEELKRIGELAAKAILSSGGERYTVGEFKSILYQTSGSSTDWARGAKAIKYVYTMELRDTGRYGFLLPAMYIKATAEEAMIFIRTIAKAAYK